MSKRVNENHRAGMKKEVADMIVELLEQAESTLNPNDTWDTLTGVFVALSKEAGKKLPDWIYGEENERD